MLQSDNDLKKLQELTGHKHELALEILDLTRQQGEILGNPSQEEVRKLEDFQRLLARRQDIIKQINNLDIKITSLKVSLAHPENIAATEENIRAVFREAHKIDKHNNLILQKMMDSLSKRMKSLQAGKVFSGKYTKKPRQIQGFFIDKKK